MKVFRFRLSRALRARFLNPLPSLSCNLLLAVMPPSELDKGRLVHALRYGPLSPLLKCDLRAELRLDVRRWDSLTANPPTITLRRRLATELACPARALGARATALFNRNSGSCLIGTHAGLLPWLRLRTVLRASCPSDARARNRCREGRCFGSVLCGSTFQTSAFILRTSVAAASSPPLVLRLRWAGLATLGRTRYGRRYSFLLETLLGCLLEPDS